MKSFFKTLILPLLSLTSCLSISRYDSYPDANKYLVGNQEYKENISSLDIDWLSGNLVLIEDSTIEGVKVEEYTNLTKDEEKVHSYLNNGELKIKFFASNYHRLLRNSNYKKDLVITYKPKLTNLKIELTSGSCTAANLTPSDCNINITSGNIEINNIVSNTIHLDGTSGNMELNKIETKEFYSDITSGDLNTAFASVEKAKMSLTSGDIDLTIPTSGGKVKVSKTSGLVTTNRQCTINNGEYTFGSGESIIEVSMTSGRLTIN